MSSPAFNEKLFNKIETTRDSSLQTSMTVAGAINKTGILFLLMLSTSILSWTLAKSGMNMMPIMLGSIVVNLILGFVIIFKKEFAPTLSPVYALVEGFVLGTISVTYEVLKPGIAMNAMMSTFSCLAVMLALYHFKILQATPRFQKIMGVSMFAIMLTYLCSMVAGFFGHSIAFIHEASPIGIIFSLVIVGVAALNFILDFALIEEGAARKAPQYMEWYCAFGVLLTLVWLYLEILRLLSKLSRK